MLLENVRGVEKRMQAGKAGRIHTRIAAFKASEAGSMLVFGMFILILMLMSAGIAIDAMRMETTRTKLQNTSDRAALAAADLDQTEDVQQVVADYFEKDGLGDYLDSVTVSNSTAAGQLSFRRVSITTSAEVDSMFMQMLGIDTMTASAASTAEEGITDLEISLVVDVSGSMGSNSNSGHSKIYDLREAAKDFVYYMQCNPNATRASNAACTVESGKVSVSLIPYSEQVVAGDTLLDQLQVSDEHDWSHCVTFDAQDFLTPMLYWDMLNTDNEAQRTGHFDPWSGYSSSSNISNNYASDGNRTCRTDSWREIRPFLKTHTEVISRINSLSAGGNTSIDVGMKWGAALLDPTARDAISALTLVSNGSGGTVVDPVFTGRPYSYTQDYSMKVIVLMTDGVNTTQHFLKDGYREGMSPIYRNTSDSSKYSIYRASTNQYYYVHDGSWNSAPYGDIDNQQVTTTQTSCSYSWWYGYRCTTTTSTQTINQPGSAVQMTYQEVWQKFRTDWYAHWSWLEDPVDTVNNSEKNTRLQEICDATKDSGVIVYTIGFEVDGNADDVMSDCASTPGHYFAANGTNLAATFGTIASSINQLRLTQ